MPNVQFKNVMFNPFLIKYLIKIGNLFRNRLI